MPREQFMFADGWNFSYNGKVLSISDEDLKNYEENGLTRDEIKIIAFSYLSKQLFADFTKSPTQTNYEFEI